MIGDRLKMLGFDPAAGRKHQRWGLSGFSKETALAFSGWLGKSVGVTPVIVLCWPTSPKKGPCQNILGDRGAKQKLPLGFSPSAFA